MEARRALAVGHPDCVYQTKHPFDFNSRTGGATIADFVHEALPKTDMTAARRCSGNRCR